MTMYQIDAYLSQIRWVSNLERIRSYIHGIYALMYKWLCNTDLPDELDEDETLEAHKERELERVQRLAELSDIPSPKEI